LDGFLFCCESPQGDVIRPSLRSTLWAELTIKSSVLDGFLFCCESPQVGCYSTLFAKHPVGRAHKGSPLLENLLFCYFAYVIARAFLFSLAPPASAGVFFARHLHCVLVQ